MCIVEYHQFSILARPMAIFVCFKTFCLWLYNFFKQIILIHTRIGLHLIYKEIVQWGNIQKWFGDSEKKVITEQIGSPCFLLHILWHIFKWVLPRNGMHWVLIATKFYLRGLDILPLVIVSSKLDQKPLLSNAVITIKL